MLLLLFFLPQSVESRCLYIFLQLHDSRAAPIAIILHRFIHIYIYNICMHPNTLTHSHHKNFLFRYGSSFPLCFIFVCRFCRKRFAFYTHFLLFLLLSSHSVFVFVSWIFVLCVFPFLSLWFLFSLFWCVCMSECLRLLSPNVSAHWDCKRHTTINNLLCYTRVRLRMYVCYDVTQHVIMQSHTHFKIKQICPPCTPSLPKNPPHTIPSQLAMYGKKKKFRTEPPSMFVCVSMAYALKQK